VLAEAKAPDRGSRIENILDAAFNAKARLVPETSAGCQSATEAFLGLEGKSVPTSRAITLLPNAAEMASRSGKVLGAAARCGVPASRIAAVRRTTLELIRQVAFDRADMGAAQREQERAIREARQRTAPTDCPSAVQAFERAEKN
jgi:hypothetical protein